MPLADAGGTESAEEELGAAVKRQRALEPAGDVRIVPTNGTGPKRQTTRGNRPSAKCVDNYQVLPRYPERDDV